MQQATEEKVNELLDVIKTKMKEMGIKYPEKVFLNGNCGNLYTIFANYFFPKTVIPYLILYKDEPLHIVSKIDGDLYDITGKTSLEQYSKYMQQNNRKKNYEFEGFYINEIPYQEREKEIKKRTDMYIHDELDDDELDDEFDVSPVNIDNVMGKLELYIRQFKASKEK